MGLPGKLVALGLAAVVAGLDAGTFGPALPALRDGLRLNDPQAAWLLSAYVVGTLLGNPGNGWFSARKGPRSALAGGLVVYGVGAVVLALATDVVGAAAGRLLQGIGAGSLVPIATATLAAMVPSKTRGRAIMLLALVYALPFLAASASASMIGASTWRGLYAGMAAVGLCGAALTLLLLPAQQSLEPAPLDVRGLALWSTTVAALAVVVPQVRGASLGRVPLVAASLVAGVGFVWSVFCARRVAQPFVPLDLLRQPLVRGACALAIAVGAAQVFAVSLPSFAAVVVGIAAPRVGLWSLPFVVSGIVGTSLAAVVIDRLGARRVVVVSGVALVVGALALAVAPGAGLAFACITALIGAGLCTLSGGPIRTLVAVDATDGARVQTLLALVTNIGLLCGSAVYGALASTDADLGPRAAGMRSGTAAIAALVSVLLAVGLHLLPPATRARARR